MRVGWIGIRKGSTQAGRIAFVDLRTAQGQSQAGWRLVRDIGDFIQPAPVLANADAAIFEVAPAQSAEAAGKAEGLPFPERFTREAGRDPSIDEELQAIVLRLRRNLPPK